MESVLKMAVCGYIRTSEHKEAAYLEISSKIAEKAVAKIAEYAFSDCKSISLLPIAWGIGAYASDGCTGLKTINLVDGFHRDFCILLS